MPKASAATPPTSPAADFGNLFSTGADQSAAASIPMYRRADDPDAPRRVTAPGGYEWWHFDAVSADARTRIIARFGFGPQFDAAWLRRYRRYRRRPTRVAPPIPSDEAYLELRIFHDGRQAADFCARAQSEAVEIEDAPLRIRIGTAALERAEEGVFHIVIPHRGGAGATLSFRPLAAASLQERAIPPGDPEGRHFWLPSPVSDVVEGTLHVAGDQAAFAGRGWREHSFGTGPIRPAFTWWLSGRLLDERGVIAFRWTRPAGGAADAACLVVGEGLEASVTAPAVTVDAPSRPPTIIALGDALRLESPQVIAREEGRALVVYRASGERSGEAMCEVLWRARGLPLRLSWRR